MSVKYSADGSTTAAALAASEIARGVLPARHRAIGHGSWVTEPRLDSDDGVQIAAILG